ncbi:MAG: hypothetical protein IJ879_10215 [Muribaculaceae bacterium]|nr:hypothetical protein [Muribaculaceae bacterium]
MSETDLRELAKSMGLKKFDTTPREDLQYQLLDHQAETEAANEAANTPEPAKRRRERIRQPAAKANGSEVTKDDAVSKNNKNKEQAKVELPKTEDKPAEQAEPAEADSLHNLLPSANADAPRPPRRLHVRQN